MNKDCAITRDLMPQVIDAVASEDSRALVETHIAGCAECAQVYADMSDEIAATENKPPKPDAPSFADAMAQLRKTMGWKRIKTAMLAILVTLVIIIIGYTAYIYLYINPSGRLMPLDAYEVTLYQSSDATVYGNDDIL